MFLSDVQWEKFNASIGFDTRKFDVHILCKTNESSPWLFSVILDVHNSIFLEYLEKCSSDNLQLLQIDQK